MHLDTGIKGKSPWYLSPHAGSMETNAKKGDDKEFTKVREDPLQAMKSMLDKHEKHRRKRSKSPSRTRRHHRESTREQKLRQVRLPWKNGLHTFAEIHHQVLITCNLNVIIGARRNEHHVQTSKGATGERKSRKDSNQ